MEETEVCQDTEQANQNITDIHSNIQDKTIRFFKYLEKVFSLNEEIVRDFRTQLVPPSPWWIADYPTDLDNLFIRKLITEKDLEDSSEQESFLRVQKKSIEQPPSLPTELVEWVVNITPLEEPKPLEKIDRKITFESDKERISEFKEFGKNFRQGIEIPEKLAGWIDFGLDSLPKSIGTRYIPDMWTTHPELETLLSGYIENSWKPWALKVSKIYRANLLYDQLYALRLLLKQEGDSIEFLLGNGIITWKHPSAGTICAPVFFTPLVLDFDPAKRIITINPDPISKNFVETNCISEINNINEIDIDRWMGILNSGSFDFWHFETLKQQANTLVNYLSPNIDDNFKEEITSSITISNNPSIWNAPLIILRKRTNNLWSKYANCIRQHIEEQDVKSNEFINDLIGEYNPGEASALINAEDVGGVVSNKKNISSINDTELFFPLPWNEEQKKIAELIDSNYGVVVKGPPGTGKSHTIANLISRFLAQGKSVLVTSQTAKALDVLRDKLPKDIRSLAVSQLEQTARRDNILQQSVSEISSNLAERETKFSDLKISSIRKQLSSVRERKASIANSIRQYILADSTLTLEINGEGIKPIEAAKLINKYNADGALDWFTDDIRYDNEINFTSTDLKEAYKLLRQLNEDDRDLYKFNLPDISCLPKKEEVYDKFAEYKICQVKSKKALNIFGNFGNSSNQEALNSFLDRLTAAYEVLSAIKDSYEWRILNACIKLPSEREKWGIILSGIDNNLQIITKSTNKNIGHRISISCQLGLNDLCDGINEIKSKLTDNGKLGKFRIMLLSSRAKEIIKGCSVDGRSPNEEEGIILLEAMISKKRAEDNIKILIETEFSNITDAPVLKWDKFERIKIDGLVSSLKKIVGYYDNFLDIEETFKKIKQLSSFSFSKLEDISEVKDLIESAIAQGNLSRLEEVFSEWLKLFSNTGINRHKINQEFIQAIQHRDAGAWAKAIENLLLLTGKNNLSIRLHELFKTISKYAPNLYKDIVELSNKKVEFVCPENIDLAWKNARLKSWLAIMHQHMSIDELQGDYDRLSKNELQLNSDLITAMAWQKQIDKVTKKQRDALMAWSEEMRKYGKGTGKWAYKHRLAAQEALKEAKNAVPVWIMPLYRVAEMFSDPRPGMFDVVIFDEASQCDIRGINIAYLGKKLLIVGDPDQISPAGIFQDQSRVFNLISQLLYDIPHNDGFSIDTSLFALAQIRMPNMIQLNEHFRCVPDIVEFSNHYIYDGKLKPLRYPNPKGLLKPALVPVLVEGGYQNAANKINEPEAKAIVNKIVQCIDDPAYQQRPDGHMCSFGVISLLAEDQAKYIKDLLLKHPKIGENVIEARNIICGDAYAFQGDERDVMFLSMVKALDPNKIDDRVKALTDKGTAQRFNVAATRARDQVFLYHSIPLSEFGNKDDWRYRILNWYYNPKTEEIEAGRAALKREFDQGRASQFSVDVGNILIDKGYRVFPEYPVIGYRIDLVVQGESARLAVECDGDQYHTIESLEADNFRENLLRRAGWTFWRISGSSFYRNREKALKSLWVKLEELGIKPITEE